MERCMIFYFTPCYFQLKIVITQPESGQLLPWHPQDLHGICIQRYADI